MKKFMKALALALAFCMVLSVSAFAAVTSDEAPAVSAAARTVTFTVQGLADEQVALLVLKQGIAPQTASESDILYINQKLADDGEVSFTATIAAGAENDLVDVYVGSASIKAQEGAAWDVYKDVSLAAAAAGITFVTGGKIILNVDADTTRPGAAVLANVNDVDIDKMIWVVSDSSSSKLYSAPIDVDYTGLSGDIWFTGVFSSTRLAGFNIADVALLFHGTDGETYYINIDPAVAEDARNK